MDLLGRRQVMMVLRNPWYLSDLSYFRIEDIDIMQPSLVNTGHYVNVK